MPEECRVGGRVLKEVDSASVGVHCIVRSVNSPVENVLLIGELIIASGIALHIEMRRGDDPGRNIEQGNHFHVLVFVELDSIVGCLLVFHRYSDLGSFDQSVESRIGQNGRVVGSCAVVAIVEFTESQGIGACKAYIPVNCGVHTVSGWRPEQGGEVIRQKLEFHLHANVSPELLDNCDGVKQVTGVVYCPDRVASVPAGFCKELLCLFRVVGILGQTVSLPVSFRYEGLVSGCNGSIPECIDDGIHIDGIPECLTDADILQRVGVSGPANTVSGCRDGTQCKQHAQSQQHCE